MSKYWLFLAIFILGADTASFAQAQGPQSIRPRPQPGVKAPSPSTIMIATGDIDSTEARVISEMARSLNDGVSLRVIPMIGQGSIQNISDLLTIKTLDVAVIQYDVLSQFRKTQKINLIENKLQYITKLYSQEIHLLSKMQFTCLADLNGRKVNFGTRNSGAALTAEIIFSAHNIKVQPIYIDQIEALEKLKTGEIDASFYVGGKPSSVFRTIKHTDRVHFLDIDYIDQLQQDYLPGIVTHDDYPDLVSSDETVSTVSVSSVLVMAGHKSQSEQFRRLTSFSDKLFENINNFKTRDYHEKWQEVNLVSPIVGWTRFPAAQNWLDQNAAKLAKAEALAGKTVTSAAQTTLSADGQNAEQVRAMLNKFLQTQGSGNPANREELFNQFVRWYEKQSR